MENTCVLCAITYSNSSEFLTMDNIQTLFIPVHITPHTESAKVTDAVISSIISTMADFRDITYDSHVF